MGKTLVLFIAIILICQIQLLGQIDTSDVIADTIEQLNIPNLPPITTMVEDRDNDEGNALIINWNDPGYSALPGFVGYQILRISGEKTEEEKVTLSMVGTSSYVDEDVNSSTSYQYLVAAVFGDHELRSELSAEITPEIQYFNKDRLWLAIIGFLVCGSVIYFIETAKRGKKLFLRKIAGLEAVDEAVGRATEMGRPILFIAGISDMDDVQTLAGLTILGCIGRTIAEYDTKITMPTRTSLVMTAARDTLKESYLSAGKPDAYSDDMVYYVTDEQFGFAAAVNGVLVREKPAACFYLGTFHAESLIMAETGNSIGAIQIAGTAQPAQLPFFIAACDYTLIGEELFAASAYLSNEPRQLGSLKGQDVGKVLAMVAIIIGVLASTMVSMWGTESMAWVLDGLYTVFTSR